MTFKPLGSVMLILIQEHALKVAVIFGEILFSQKQPPEELYKKGCSLKFRKIHRKTPEPESLF